ncbi:MAG: GmrSD restriction endonuclease domain-containing protein [Thermoplasmata archaeon]
MKIDSAIIKTISIRKLYDEEMDSLLLPSIQRDFVWDIEQIKDLVESIINNYPIGSIILWKTNEKIPSSKLFDNINNRENNLKERNYIIDGQQRLTSLVLIKNNFYIKREGRDISLEKLYYIPENNSFAIGRKKGIDLSLIVNATLGDPDALENIKSKFPKDYKNVVKNIGAKILNYEIPFYYIETYSDKNESVYESIANIFTKVNSAGTKIGNLEIFLSFFAASFPNKQKNKIIEFHDEMSKNYLLDLEPIIRFIFAELGLSQYQITRVKNFKSAINTLKEQYAKNLSELDKELNKCFISVKNVMNFLKEDLGFSSTKYLPSQNMLVPLFDYVYRNNRKNLTQFERKQMENWFLLGSFHGLYSGSPTNKLMDDLKIIKESKSSFPYKLLKENIKNAINVDKIRKKDLDKGIKEDSFRKNNYIMLLFAILYKNNATNWAGEIINFENVTVHHIFPKDYLIENGIDDSDKINSLSNLTFIQKDINSKIGNTPPSEYLKQYDSKVLSTHLIPLDQDLWKSENYDKFIKERGKLIWNAIKKFEF